MTVAAAVKSGVPRGYILRDIEHWIHQPEVGGLIPMVTQRAPGAPALAYCRVSTQRQGRSGFGLEAGVQIAEIKFLLHHSVSSGGVTMGYLHPSLEHLRGWQEKTTGPHSIGPRAWVRCGLM